MEYFYFIVKPIIFTLSLLASYGSWKNFEKAQKEAKSDSVARFEAEKQVAIGKLQHINANSSIKEAAMPALVAAQFLTREDIETLKTEFDFEGNANLEQAQIILFSENHASSKIINKNFQLLAQMIKPGDIILLESGEKTQNTCTGLVSKIIETNYPVLFNETEISESARAIYYIQNQLDRKEWPFKDVETLGWDLKQWSKKDNATMLESVCYPVAMAGDFLFNRDNHMFNRNSVLEDIFSKLKCRRIFVVGGSQHWPSIETKNKYPKYEFVLKTEQILAPYRYSIATLKNFKTVGKENTHLSKVWDASIGLLGGTVCLLIIAPLSMPSPQPVLAFMSRVGVLILSSGFIEKAPILAVLIQVIQMLPDWLHATTAGIYMVSSVVLAFGDLKSPSDSVNTTHLDGYCP